MKGTTMDNLPDTMRALMLHGPGDRLSLEDVPRPKPGAGEVLVRIAASPINPSDLAMLAGEYGLRWPYPLIPGLEGSGVVLGAGSGVMGRVVMGKNVALVGEKQGLWADYAVVPASRVLPLPKDMPLGAGASSFVNPLTAIALVGEVRRAKQWCAISTAAGGALGAMIRRRAKEKGVKIINIGRKHAQVEALKAEGARFVLDEAAADFDADLAALCKDLRCRMAFDAVGGQLTFRVGQALRSGGQILVYGGLSGAPASVHPGTMIFKGLTVKGFWLSQWLAKKTAPQMLLMTREVTKGLQSGFAQTQVARHVPLELAADAPDDYARNMSGGKILISTGAYPLGL
ncbi:zinc-dependent alcohol dehydrogenase family protein [Jannaschia sp. CCS1]|uniref:zinc-dependent alcohol dehydrogenase family protein n=1 Tax=Jannaschia sp. (strain CCS1) TaxID=290400 RepID=UPI00140F9E5C|nr:zinc-dependent alcohol dehydrogenase family protein [Jannaschia sp. CCS1]